jgi:hypothetical protein
MDKERLSKQDKKEFAVSCSVFIFLILWFFGWFFLFFFLINEDVKKGKFNVRKICIYESIWVVDRRFGFDRELGNIPLEEARKIAGGNLLKSRIKTHCYYEDKPKQ